MISFKFASLEFTNSAQNQFKYQLVGFENEPIFSGRNKIATYTNLDPGSYTLKVSSANDDNIWDASPYEFNLTVIPPFWMTWWFRLLALSFSIAIPSFISHYRLSKKLELERLRTKIAIDLHDEVGPLLTSISINADLIGYEKDINNVKIKGKAIRDKSREIVNSISDVIWSIDSRKDNLDELINRMYNFASDLLVEKDIIFDFQTDIINREKNLKVDFRQNIFLIFRETINNAVKYSETSKITVSLSYISNHFSMHIIDYGKGLNIDKLK